MATKLTKPVTRVLNLKDLNGIEGEVAVTINEGGLYFSKGHRRLGFVAWADIAKLSHLPLVAPAKFSGNPIGWLVELSQ